MDMSDAGYLDVVGKFYGEVDFDPTDGVDIHVSNGARDCFISRFDLDGNWQWANTFGSTNEDNALGVGSDQDGNVYVTGFIEGDTEWDPGFETWETTLIGLKDFYLVKYLSDGTW